MDRIRFNNIMNRGYGLREIHPIWPYAAPTFTSPTLPATTAPLPYPMPGIQPVPTAPLFQNLAINSVPLNTVSSNANSTHAMIKGHTNFHSIPAKLRPIANNISNSNQPSIPPLPQSTEKNVNLGPKPVTDGLKILLNDNATSSKNEAAKTCLELHNSNSSSNEDSKIISHGTTEDKNESEDSAELTVSSTLILLSPLKFNELARLALKGSEIAEKLAFTHRNRPCFKKIDNLCARMKQDLLRPDSVLANINSQGIAWAVKDFIFVFTRVINAWIIIKGYVYNTPDELKKIKQAFSPELVASFAAWQDSTLVFVENLIKSFISLDNLIQSQKSAYQKTDLASCSSDVRCSSPHVDPFEFLSTSVDKVGNDLNDKYLLNMVENSENSQHQANVNGTYFKTGTYNPIKKEDIPLDNQATTSTCSNTSSDLCSSDWQTSISNDTMPKCSSQISEGNSDCKQYVGIPHRSPSELNSKSELNILDTIKLNGAKYIDDWLTYDLHVLQEQEHVNKNFTYKLNMMIDHLMSMKNADLFFRLHFTKNYFPEFIARHRNDFMDVRSIILKCQVGEYNNIYQVVHDIRKIIYAGKQFLKFNQDQKLCNSVKAFEAEFNTLLTQPPFNSYSFDHINGEPHESLF